MCNSTHATTLKAVTTKTNLCDLVTRREFSCLQEIPRLSISVLNCLAAKKKSIRLVTSYKNALTFLISEHNWLHFATTEGRGNEHANTAASINTKKTCLHPTTDSALRPIVLIVAVRMSNIEIVQMFRSGPKTALIHDSNTGPKTIPTNHGTCERKRQGQRSQHAKTPVLQNKNILDKAAGGKKRISKRHVENCTKVKTDVENCRLLQHAGSQASSDEPQTQNVFSFELGETRGTRATDSDGVAGSFTSARRRAHPGRISEETRAFRVRVSSEAEVRLRHAKSVPRPPNRPWHSWLTPVGGSSRKQTTNKRFGRPTSTTTSPATSLCTHVKMPPISFASQWSTSVIRASGIRKRGVAHQDSIGTASQQSKTVFGQS